MDKQQEYTVVHGDDAQRRALFAALLAARRGPAAEDLGAHGLAIVQLPLTGSVATLLIHEGGAFIEASSYAKTDEECAVVLKRITKGLGLIGTKPSGSTASQAPADPPAEVADRREATSSEGATSTASASAAVGSATKIVDPECLDVRKGLLKISSATLLKLHEIGAFAPQKYAGAALVALQGAIETRLADLSDDRPGSQRMAA